MAKTINQPTYISASVIKTHAYGKPEAIASERKGTKEKIERTRKRKKRKEGKPKRAKKGERKNNIKQGKERQKKAP